MSKIAKVFADLKAQGRKGLVPFITAGDPEPGITLDLMHALVRGGADVIELGVPFSDPMADGPVIQRASERALSHGTTLKHCIELVKQFRQTNDHTPVVLMGYANPIEHMGTETFVRTAKDAGVDGILVVDYPPEECEDFAKQCKAAGIDPISYWHRLHRKRALNRLAKWPLAISTMCLSRASRELLIWIPRQWQALFPKSEQLLQYRLRLVLASEMPNQPWPLARLLMRL